MSDYPFSEADLRAAAFAVSESMLTSLPKSEEIQHDFSEDFLQKMDALLARDRRQRRGQAMARRAAMIALAVLVGIGAWLCVDSQARASIIKWVREISEYGFAYRFSATGTGRELPGYSVFRDMRCTIGYLPEGYEDQQHDYLDYGEIHCFVKKGLSEGIFFSWGTLNEKGEYPRFYYGLHEGGSQTVTISGNKGEFLPDKDGVGGTLHWVDGTFQIQLELHSAFDRKTMLKIARSIRIEETPDIPEYAPSWIPEGFIEGEISYRRTTCSRDYSNPADQRYMKLFYQFTRQGEGYGYIVGEEYDSVESLTIQGSRADYFTSNGEREKHLLVWMDEEMNVLFRLEGTVSQTDLIQTAESVRLVEAPE